jgi:hypothetical protein
MKMTMSALAALVVTATDVRANETVGNTVQLPDSKDAKVRPGGYSPSHTHAKSALIFATVIEGEVRSKVNDGPEKTYRTGELPGDHHRVSANASETRPAKILAVFVVDDQDKMLRYPPKVRPLGRACPLRPST